MSFAKLTHRINTATGTAINLTLTINDKTTLAPVDLSAYTFSFGAKSAADETTTYAMGPVALTPNSGYAQGVVDVGITPAQNTLTPGAYLGELAGTSGSGTTIRVQMPMLVAGRVIVPAS